MEYYQFDYRPALTELRTLFDQLSTQKQHIPEIYLIAGEYDPQHPFEGAEESAKLLGDYAKYIIIANTGDPVYRDQPEISLKLLKSIITDDKEYKKSLNL